MARASAKPARPKPAPARPKPEPAFVPPVARVEETVEILPLDRDPPPDEEFGENRTTRYVEARQEEMQFEPTRGRFENTAETIYRGENLDQPTFRRRRLAIKL